MYDSLSDKIDVCDFIWPKIQVGKPRVVMDHISALSVNTKECALDSCEYDSGR